MEKLKIFKLKFKLKFYLKLKKLKINRKSPIEGHATKKTKPKKTQQQKQTNILKYHVEIRKVKERSKEMSQMGEDSGT